MFLYVSKLQDNLARAKARVQELALANPWTLFVTFTLNPEKYNRNDLPRFVKDLSQFIRDFRKKTGHAVKYLLIPEKHKDGSWHMHGFLMGLPFSELYAFQEKDYLPHKIRNRLKEGKRVFTWLPYHAKFGFADIEVIENQEATARYITKYVTKDVLRSVTELNAHMFYASKGLQASKLIFEGFLANEIHNPTYQNEHITAKWCKSEEEARSYFEERSADDLNGISG